MITFRHKSNIKRIKIKSTRELNERMSPFLQNIFGIKHPIVGFKTMNNKYYDTETFYTYKERFYGQVVDIIQANDQLEISFVSDNLNSSSNIRNVPQPLFVQDQNQEAETSFKMVNDTRDMERRLQDKNQLNILFTIHKIYLKEITESINMIKSQQNSNKLNFYVKINTNGTPTQSNYRIYVGRKLVATLNLTREYKENILMVTERYFKKLSKNQQERPERHEQREQNIFRASFEQQNQAPSFTTYQLQERLNQEACLDYLRRMSQQKVLKKYEYLKLVEKCQENFVEFYRIFCQGAIDNDYENFKNQILHKVQNNLELLLSNVDELDLSRPISREEQRRQNLKKSVSNIQIVKVQNYFEILDQLKPLLNPSVIGEIKSELLDQNETIFHGFADYLSRKISKEELAAFLERAVGKRNVRPVSRCLPRSANRNREPAYNSQDQIFTMSQQNTKLASLNAVNNFEEERIGQPVQKEQAQLIKLMESGGKENKNQNKEVPPMFGSSKQENNFSPIKYMSDIESNYKQAWTRLQGKSDLFQPQEYGLLYHYLQTRDDSISNHIQQLEWNEKSSINKLKTLLEQRITQIMENNFTLHELDVIALNRDAPNIDCIFQNFKYESDLAKFLASLHSQVSIITKSPLSSRSPSPSCRPASTRPQVLTKKSSDSKLLDKGKKSMRKYSDENQSSSSPKQSSFSHAKTNEPSLAYLEILNNFWNEEFQQMIDHCNFTQERRQEYLRESFKEGNPSVYSWINSFVQGKLGILDTKGLKYGLRVRDQENKYIMRIVPIFSEILRSFVQEGKITDKMRKWCVVELLELNTAILGAFEEYIKMKNADDFIDNLSVAFELQNNEMQQYRNYLKRIQNVLKEMSSYDEIGLSIFKLYPKHIRAISELYFINGDIEELMDNLDVLHRVERQRRTIKVATLNFSGININPFEYFDGSEQLQKISDYMKQILQTEQKVLNEKLSVIDKEYTKNRMSVRFGLGMCDSQTLLGRDQFCKKWRECYNVQKSPLIKGDTEDIIEASILFDYYCYICVVRYLYGVNWTVKDYTGGVYKHMSKQYVIEGIQKLESKKLKEYLEAKQNRPASKIDKKYQLAMEYLMKNNLDVFFLQQAGDADWGQELIHDYSWVKGGDSVIIYRKDKFGHMKTNLLEQYKQKLNFNNDTAIFFGDRGYLLLSVHLRSKLQLCTQQAKQIFKALEELYDAHPMIKIIIGIDANHFIGGCQSNFLNFVPKTNEEATTIKMRTYAQVQFKKSGEMVKASKDAILSNLEFKDYSIRKINRAQATDKDLLPSDEHPYDHFIVAAQF